MVPAIDSVGTRTRHLNSVEKYFHFNIKLPHQTKVYLSTYYPTCNKFTLVQIQKLLHTTHIHFKHIQ